MRYKEMSIEEALRLGESTVLVAVKDLEDETDTIQEFQKANREEYNRIIKDSETIIKLCGDMISYVKAFTEQQNNFPDIENKGEMSTILFP